MNVSPGDQLDLELRPPISWAAPDPPSRPVPTSEDAAREAWAFAGEQRERVYVYLASCGAHGATQKEAERALEISRQSLAARFWELAGGKHDGAWPLRIRIDRERRREGCYVYITN